MHLHNGHVVLMLVWYYLSSGRLVLCEWSVFSLANNSMDRRQYIDTVLPDLGRATLLYVVGWDLFQVRLLDMRY